MRGLLDTIIVESSFDLVGFSTSELANFPPPPCRRLLFTFFVLVIATLIWITLVIIVVVLFVYIFIFGEGAAG
jgi:hypothetical protein